MTSKPLEPKSSYTTGLCPRHLTIPMCDPKIQTCAGLAFVPVLVPVAAPGSCLPLYWLGDRVPDNGLVVYCNPLFKVGRTSSKKNSKQPTFWQNCSLFKLRSLFFQLLL